MIRSKLTRLTSAIAVVAVLLSGSLIGQFTVANAAESPSQACKAENQNGNSVLNIGWPRDSNDMTSVGEVKILVVGADFSNAPETGTIQTITSGFELAKVADFYSTSSYGRLSVKFVMNPTIIHIPISDIGIDDRQVTRQVVSLLPSQYKLSDFDGLITFTTPNASYAGRSAQPGQVFANSTGEISSTAVLAGIKTGIASWTPWQILAHEIGHLFGLMDLWDSSDSNAWNDKSAAPYDLMSTGAGWNYAPDFFAWEKWILGWIPDSDVRCVIDTSVDQKFAISKLGESSGTRLIVVKEGNGITAIEYRGTSRIDVGISKPGFLVYQIDLSKTNFELPIKIIPSSEASLAPLRETLPDWQRNKTATLSDLDSLNAGNFLVGRSDSGSEAMLYLTESTPDHLRGLMNPPKEAAGPSAKPLRSVRCQKVSNKKITKVVSGTSPKCPAGYKKI